MVVGKLTQDFANELKAVRIFKTFDISSTNPDLQDLKAFIKLLVGYQSVNIFFGTYQSIITQVAKRTNISGEEMIENEFEKNTDTQTKSFIFEPDLEEILSFFETQIFASLFKQTLNESNLAQIGSRVNLLEDASREIDDLLVRLQLENRKAIKLRKNKAQLKEFSGAALWKIF
jgi:F0F1-type ATP synthase gamma subunit